MTAMGRRGPLGASDKIMGQFLPYHHHGVPPHCPATPHHTTCAVWCLITQPPHAWPWPCARYVVYPFCLAVLIVCLFAVFCRFWPKFWSQRTQLLVRQRLWQGHLLVVASTQPSQPAAPWWGSFWIAGWLVGGGGGWHHPHSSYLPSFFFPPHGNLYPKIPVLIPIRTLSWIFLLDADITFLSVFLDGTCLRFPFKKLKMKFAFLILFITLH